MDEKYPLIWFAWIRVLLLVWLYESSPLLTWPCLPCIMNYILCMTHDLTTAIIMIMHELLNGLKTSVHWACQCPTCGCVTTIDNTVEGVTSSYGTVGTWKNYPTCFALLDVGVMIVLRRANRYVLIWACSAELTNLQLSSFQTSQL